MLSRLFVTKPVGFLGSRTCHLGARGKVVDRFFNPQNLRWQKRQFHTSQRVRESARSIKLKPGGPKRITWKEFKNFVKLAHPERYILSFALLCLGINAGSNLLIPYGMGKAMDSSVKGVSHEDDEESKKQREEAKHTLYKVSGLLVGGKSYFLSQEIEE